ncbi:hypothetical protein [Methylobacterium sp. J-070]|uniref:hypothetical protein n=1 Tax=Methylobacterium sp. J-070 TaxID=2836650 RepID=UPI001FBBAFD8|nr:hypothetical protein [Methylobacterium sp. J-070]MCJ2050199.1 hypothetical protein [Methylobacterium sp. J-070]
MATDLLPALRRNLVLWALAFAAASLAFGAVMLAAPPTSEAAVTETATSPPVTNCEFLPAGDASRCTVYR